MAGDPSFPSRLPPGTQPGEINEEEGGEEEKERGARRRKKPVSTRGSYSRFHCRRPPHPHTVETSHVSAQL